MKRICVLICAAFVFLLLTGCNSMSIEDMYSLPEMSESHSKLQQLISAELAAGSEYSAPTSGSYRQSVQLYDIDGDNINEALAFFRGSDQTPKICIYRRDGGDYSQKATITGEGASIGRVEYADLNGDGDTELIVAWQISPSLRILKVYSLNGLSGSVLLTANCTDFYIADLSMDGLFDLIALRVGASDEKGADVYSFSAGEPQQSGAKLSSSLAAIDRVRTGILDDGVTALFIEGKTEDGTRLITDILTWSNRLRNITLSADSGDSSTMRNPSDNAYASDIDGDKVLEIPETVPLPSQAESITAYSVLDWYSFDSAGRKIFKRSTYHSGDGWYLYLPDSWRGDLTVRRADGVSGERAVVLSHMLETGEIVDFLKIYTLTGDNRRDRSRQSKRFVLLDNGTTIYAAELLPDSSSADSFLTESEVTSRFNIIRSEWMTGAV